ISDIGSALFIAAGGYHHHIAVNTWGTAGAGPRAAALGLGQVNIALPDDDDVAALRQRLTDHGVGVRHDGAVLRFDDPWGTLIQVEATRSEEHTSELQSRFDLVCRLLLE